MEKEHVYEQTYNDYLTRIALPIFPCRFYEIGSIFNL